MARKKSVYRPTRPPEHLVSAIIEEPHDRLGLWVLRWWYGDMPHEQVMTLRETAARYIDNIRQRDLHTMETKVWGMREETPFGLPTWPPSSPPPPGDKK